MTIIGHFTRDDDGIGFIGHLDTLVFNQDIIIVAARPSGAPSDPHYRVHIFDGMNNEAGAQIGDAWNHGGKRAGDHVALVMDDPAFGQPIHADLSRDDDDGTRWSLHWSRQRHDSGKD